MRALAGLRPVEAHRGAIMRAVAGGDGAPEGRFAVHRAASRINLGAPLETFGPRCAACINLGGTACQYQRNIAMALEAYWTTYWPCADSDRPEPARPD